MSDFLILGRREGVKKGTKISLFLTFKKLGFQIDPLPPLNPMSLHIIFFVYSHKKRDKELFLKGGRGPIWKPNFLKVKDKEIFARRDGVSVKMSLFFTEF